ncbi:putative N-acetyltransferase CML3 [Platysternon megacephalum]|uniref:peptide-methionine (S)-S-oxide reductase n=1 Tax=Platysternon megacephalum TaxID=55544 RepID=A0A4D9DC61_9SAUR|nr:putative N-acetyltransferase CML3 [Platysternon megacephalum]
MLVTTTPRQHVLAQSAKAAFEPALRAAGYAEVTTEVVDYDHQGPFYPAEEYHQQYLVKNPQGYCPTHATGVTLKGALAPGLNVNLLGM